MGSPELHKLFQTVNKNINMLKLYHQKKEYDYNPPKMYIDDKTGQVIMEESDKREGPKVFTKWADYQAEREAVLRELELDDAVKRDKMSQEQLAHKMVEYERRTNFQMDYDPEEKMYAFSRDFMRIDIGLLIQRPPIFFQMRQRDMD
jgi:hypothetical protein